MSKVKATLAKARKIKKKGQQLMTTVKQKFFPERQGVLVVFEGIDGSGKSSALNELMNWCRMAKFPFTKIDMIPEGRIRELLLWDDTFELKQRLLLYKVEGDRARIKAEEALKTQQIVFCDRASMTFSAYQGYGEGMLKEIDVLSSIFEPFPEADKTLLFDLPAEVAIKRIQQKRRKLDNIELHDLEYHERVRQGFLKLLPESDKVIHIDAAQPEEMVFKEVLSHFLPMISAS